MTESFDRTEGSTGSAVVIATARAADCCLAEGSAGEAVATQKTHLIPWTDLFTQPPDEYT